MASEAAQELMNMKSQTFFDRKEAHARAGIAAKPEFNNKIKLQNSVFGAGALAEHKQQKLNSDKKTMIEQNWNLQQAEDQYIPQRLPFFKADETEKPQTQGLIKLQQTKNDKEHQRSVADLFGNDNSQEAILV